MEHQSSRPAAGEVWHGYLCYTSDPQIGPEGYYALERDGQTLLDPPLMLTHHDLAPGNAFDGSGEWRIADPDKPYFSHVPDPVTGRPVDLEVGVYGVGEVQS